MLRIDTIDDKQTLKQVAQLLEKENQRLHKRIEELLAKIAKLEGEDGQQQLTLELAKLQEQMNAMQRRMFGPSSERRKGDGPDDSETDEKKKKSGHGPREQLALPTEEVFFDLAEEAQRCELCGGDLAEWKGQFEESEEITVVERTFKLRNIKRRKYRCQCGACIKTAPGPRKLIEGGRYSLEFAIEVAVQKYLDHLPLERQVRIMKREGLLVTSQTLWDQIWALSCLARPTYDSLPGFIQRHPYIHLDETRWFMLAKGGRKTWQIWGQSCPFAVHYTLHPERSKAAGAVVIGDFEGTVVCDGYKVYESLAREGPPGRNLAFCWAHVRRKFIEAEPNHSECKRAVDLIRELYKVEQMAPDPWLLEGEEREDALRLRARLRDELSRPIVEELKKWAGTLRGLDGDSHIKAAKYMINHLTGLKRFLDDPRLPIDNNHAERSLRGPVIGRKNHYGSKSKRGTKVAAIFYSLIETAKLYDVNPKTYLLEIAKAALENPEAALLPSDL